MWKFTKLFRGNAPKNVGVRVGINIGAGDSPAFETWGQDNLPCLPRVGDSFLSPRDGTLRGLLVVGVLLARLGDPVTAYLFCKRLDSAPEDMPDTGGLAHVDQFAGPARVVTVPHPGTASTRAASPCPPPAQRLDVVETANVANAETSKPLAAAGAKPSTPGVGDDETTKADTQHEGTR